MLTVGAGSTLNVNSNFTQTNSASLDIQIGGTPGTRQVGQVVASGGATLGGTLSIGLANGYGPTTGDSFQVMSFGSHSGNFATFNGTVGGVAFFQPVLNDTNLSVNATNTAADLTVGSITVPANGLVNQNITINYTVNNVRDTPTTTDRWQDAVYISPNTTLDASATLLGTVPHSGVVTGNSATPAL